MLGFRVIYNAGLNEDGTDGESYELTDDQIVDAGFFLNHLGELVRDESYIDKDGEIQHNFRQPRDVYPIPRDGIDKSTIPNYIMTPDEIQQ
jgi:hypothetical protein